MSKISGIFQWSSTILEILIQKVITKKWTICSWYFRLFGAKCFKCGRMISPADWIRKARDQVKQVSLRLALFFFTFSSSIFSSKILEEYVRKILQSSNEPTTWYFFIQITTCWGQIHSKARRVEKGVSDTPFTIITKMTKTASPKNKWFWPKKKFKKEEKKKIW